MRLRSAIVIVTSALIVAPGVALAGSVSSAAGIPLPADGSLPAMRLDAPIAPADGPLSGQTVYHNSFAVLVGISHYANLPADPRCQYAAADATSMGQVLMTHYGFPPENVFILLNEQATLSTMVQVLNFLANRRLVQAEDRVLIYFSGLVQTVGSDRNTTGWLVPYDADAAAANPLNAEAFRGRCLSVRQLWQGLEASPAKHALMILDSCFDGLLVGGPPEMPLVLDGEALSGLAGRRARQAIAAGGRDDSGPVTAAFGHQPFTYKLLDLLDGAAAVPGNVFTTTQLFQAARQSVVELSGGHQTPRIGVNGTDGESLFVVVPPPSTTPASPFQPGLPGAGQPGPGAGPNGHYYQAVKVPGGITWYEAYQEAQKMSLMGMPGHLATLTSAEESRFVVTTLTDAVKDCYWLGGYQDRRAPDFHEPASGWRWVTGEKWDYTNWNQGPAKEPNNIPADTDCLRFIGAGGWNDDQEKQLAGGYVVEFEPPPPTPPPPAPANP